MPCTITDVPNSTAAQVMTAVAARLDELRMSQADLVRASGVSHPTVRRLQFEGVVPSRPKAAAIAEALGWPPDAFDRIVEGGDPSPGAVDVAKARAAVEAAISTDPNLTPELRSALLTAYRGLIARH